MELIIFILVCYGLTQVLTIGSVFKSIRPKHEFFHCSMCMGFWVGVLIYFLMGFVGVNLFAFSSPIALFFSCFLAGCLSSGTSYFLCKLIGDDGLNIHIG
jgi:hypothetical protein